MKFSSQIIRLSCMSLALCTLASCAVVTGDKHETLGEVDARTLQLPEASGQTLAQWPHQGWWTQYHDAALNELVNQALANGPSLQMLAQRMKSSEQAADAVRKSHWPAGQIKAEWTGQRFMNTDVTAYGGLKQYLDGQMAAMTQQPGAQFNGNNLSDQNQSYPNFSVGMAWDLDLWGKNRAAYRAALGQAQAQNLEYEAARQSVAANVVGLHAQIVALQQRQTLLQQMIDVQTQLKQRWLERERAGLQPTQYSVQTDVALAQMEQLSAGVGAQIEVFRAQLAALVGKTPAQLPEIRANGEQWATLNLPNEVGANILGSRPDIAAARQYIEAASEQVKSVRAQFYPDVNLSVSAALQILRMPGVLDFNGESVGVKPAITLPLFSSIQLNAKLRYQQAQLDTAVAQYNKTVYDAMGDAAQQLAQYRQSKTQVSQQTRIAQDDQKLAELAQQRYHEGMTAQMESLIAQATALREQDALYAALASRRMQEARLASSLGVGFSDMVAQPSNNNTHP